MTPCEAYIRQRIADDGPMNLEKFMDIALHHPEHGYYTKSAAIGKAGDFITAPEVSQMFGEIIGAWCIDLWTKLGAPPCFNLIELGPGRGTLISDMLRVAENRPKFLQAINLILIERNETLKNQQVQNLASHKPQWASDFTNAPLKEIPTIVIANEFFDTFPIQQFSQKDGQWFETHVTLEDKNLVFTNISTKHVPPSLEYSPHAEAYFKTVCNYISKHEGALLTIDYGYEEGQSHSLQALNAHLPISPLDNIGETDLTTHVNFKAFAEIAKSLGLAVAGPSTQGHFLSTLGILQRAQQLQFQNPLQIPQITSELMRLSAPQQMGSLFKVLCTFSPTSLKPEGFQ